MPTIMTVGDIVVEFLAKSTEQEFSETGFFEGPFPAGSAGIFATQSARLGISTGIFAKVGKDGFAELAMTHMRNAGVNLEGVSFSEFTNTGAVFVSYRENGSRRFIFHYGNSAMGELSCDDIDERLMSDCKYLFVSGAGAYATASMEKAVDRCVEIAKRNGVKIAFDPNVRTELCNEESFAKWDKMVSHTDILLGSEEELLAMTRAKRLEEALAIPPYAGVPIIVLKMGDRGSRVLFDGKDITFPAYKVTQVDPTGAGDNWAGAFLAMLSRGVKVEEAMDYANKAAALSVTKRGPSSSFDATEIAAAFN